MHSKTVISRIDKMKEFIEQLVKLISDILLKYSRYINRINVFLKNKVLEGDQIIQKTDEIVKSEFRITDLLNIIGKLSTNDCNIEIQLDKFTKILKEVEKKDMFAYIEYILMNYKTNHTIKESELKID